mmetsp:Transcript_28589/g.51977  ORF Transcript_28589/g.51977 Transcript_28589/m.51977 type:complete len:86 (+) Transcript_28589:88-345(+)
MGTTACTTCCHSSGPDVSRSEGAAAAPKQMVTEMPLKEAEEDIESIAKAAQENHPRVSNVSAQSAAGRHKRAAERAIAGLLDKPS